MSEMTAIEIAGEAEVCTWYASHEETARADEYDIKGKKDSEDDKKESQCFT